MGARLTKSDFLQRAIEVHGDTYSYDLSEYKTLRSKVKIKCTIHGYFMQIGSTHLQGKGCMSCSGKRKKTTETFIRESRHIHGDFYDYSLSVYSGIKSKVVIVCPIHGRFEQRADAHLDGRGCIKCGNSMSTNDFISRCSSLHHNKYDYSLVDYTGSFNKVMIICKNHGQFTQSPHNHLQGAGCPACARELSASSQSFDTSWFIRNSTSVHGNKYDYSETTYTNYYTPLRIKCKEHGSFSQAPRSHLNGYGCNSCSVHGYSPNSEGYVYVLRNNGIMKVGISNVFENRISRLERETPFGFVTWAVFRFNDGYKPPSVEKLLHSNLNKVDFNGLSFDGYTEWFEFEELSVLYIAGICDEIYWKRAE